MGMLWKCPYCNSHCSMGEQDILEIRGQIYSPTLLNYISGIFDLWICTNDICKQITASARLYTPGTQEQKKTYFEERIMPTSSARPFPEYIPRVLIADYEEACKIKTLSPKASATLARRCIQGMIRNYWNVYAPRLVDEIELIKDKVAPDTWAAIDAIRRVGNIGAHMEKDINVIIDVDPDEADLLIKLIEDLFEDWYITTHIREERRKAIVKLAEDKKPKSSTAQPEKPGI